MQRTLGASVICFILLLRKTYGVTKKAPSSLLYMMIWNVCSGSGNDTLLVQRRQQCNVRPRAQDGALYKLPKQQCT